MCTVSMIMEHYTEKWQQTPPATNQFWALQGAEPRITDEEIKEFRTLLDRARRYDAEHGEPNCELAEKRTKLLDLATELGVEIDFL